MIPKPQTSELDEVVDESENVEVYRFHDSNPMGVPSPLGKEYRSMSAEDAFRHAQRAGHLWQSLVGQCVRLPGHWWNGASSPPMGGGIGGSLGSVGEGQGVAGDWEFRGRYTMHTPPEILQMWIPHRSSPGRLLLHIVVLQEGKWIMDVAMGCFHPDARNIRTTLHSNAALAGCRDLWWAVRKRTGASGTTATESILDVWLSWDAWSLSSDRMETSPMNDDDTFVRRYARLLRGGPLGPGAPRVGNDNIRSIFGESPPMDTLFIQHEDLADVVSASYDAFKTPPPVLFLNAFMQHYVVSRKIGYGTMR